MTSQVLFLPAARLELLAAHEWYEREAQGLGRRFTDEVDFQLARVAANPSQFPEIVSDVRRARLRRFPYGLFFRLYDGAIYILACFHYRRDPLIWQRRL